MEFRRYYVRKKIDKNKLKISYDKISKGRPAWIKVEGLPKRSRFISIHLGKKGKEGTRLQFYNTYLLEGLYLPTNYTKEEMSIFYDKFSDDYDNYLKSTSFNTRAAEFLIKKLKEHVRSGELLDLGAGTGLITKMFVKEGFGPATLVDYSQGMLNKAKKIKMLKGSKFIKADMRKLNLKKKFDIILSFFSFGRNSYFDEGELDNILKIAKNHLKENGIFCVLGHNGVSRFEEYFKQLETGIYTLDEESGSYVDYFIGRKK